MDTLYYALAARSDTLVPIRDSNIQYSAYFIIFYIVMNYFITNLFVGVVIIAYNREKEKSGSNFMLTEKEKKWLETKLLVL